MALRSSVTLRHNFYAQHRSVLRCNADGGSYGGVRANRHPYAVAYLDFAASLHDCLLNDKRTADQLMAATIQVGLVATVDSTALAPL